MPTNIFARLNLDYNLLIQNFVIPYINKQVSPIGSAIFNMNSVNALSIYKTTSKFSGNSEDFVSRIRSGEFEDKNCTNEIIDSLSLLKSSIQSKSILQMLFTPTISQVFIIMKFKDKILDSAYEGVIKPIILTLPIVDFSEYLYEPPACAA
jgi:hypothetical protein